MWGSILIQLYAICKDFCKDNFPVVVIIIYLDYLPAQTFNIKSLFKYFCVYLTITIRNNHNSTIIIK